jgi:hypothetical protein
VPLDPLPKAEPLGSIFLVRLKVVRQSEAAMC